MYQQLHLLAFERRRAGLDLQQNENDIQVNKGSTSKAMHDSNQSKFNHQSTSSILPEYPISIA